MQIKLTTFFSTMILAALAFAPQAGATEILSTSYSGWLATTTGTPAEWDFNISNNTYNTSNGYNLNAGSYGPINVTGPDGAGYSLQKYQGYSSYNLTTLEGAADGVGSMDFTTPSAGLTAFGLGLGITGSAAPITITLSDGETFTATPSVNGTTFVGLSSGSPITSFVLTTSSGTHVQLTDFFAATSSEPATAPAAEGATAIMIGAGLLIFGGYRKVYSNISAAGA